MQIFRRPTVEKATGLSRSSIYQMMQDGTFPRPIKLGKRAVGWRAEDLESWLKNKEEKSDD